jgi:hypothetical protein
MRPDDAASDASWACSIELTLATSVGDVTGCKRLSSQ